MTKKVPYVDPQQCAGYEICTGICPNVFQMNGEGKSEVHDENGDTEENINAAIEACPAHAIKWIDKKQ